MVKNNLIPAILLTITILVQSDPELFYKKLSNFLEENPTILKEILNKTTSNTQNRKSENRYEKYEEYIHTYSEKVIVAGFRFEEHKVLTEDGYILSVWRIPGPLGNYSNVPKKPVILQHGLLDDSYTFLVLNINQSLPLELAHQG